MSPGHPRAIASERRRPLLPGWRRREAGESIVHVGAQRACMSSSGAARKLGQCGGKPAGPPFGQVPPFLPMSRFLCADAHTHCTCWPEDPQSPRHHGHLSPPSCCSVPLGWRRWSAACDDFLPVASAFPQLVPRAFPSRRVSCGRWLCMCTRVLLGAHARLFCPVRRGHYNGRRFPPARDERAARRRSQPRRRDGRACRNWNPRRPLSLSPFPLCVCPRLGLLCVSVLYSLGTP